jgi:hypothetical protein
MEKIWSLSPYLLHLFSVFSDRNRRIIKRRRTVMKKNTINTLSINERVRRAYAKNPSVGDVAKLLGIRYQRAYNVVKALKLEVGPSAELTKVGVTLVEVAEQISPELMDAPSFMGEIEVAEVATEEEAVAA